MKYELTQPHPRKSLQIRVIVIMVIGTAYYLGLFWLSGFMRDQEEMELLDQLLCPVTFVSCFKAQEINSWMQLLVINAVAFVGWLLFLSAARGFIIGVALKVRLLGLVVSLFILLAILAVFVGGLVISSIS